jgi:hypothetical protein
MGLASDWIGISMKTGRRPAYSHVRSKGSSGRPFEDVQEFETKIGVESAKNGKNGICGLSIIFLD